MTDDGRFQLLSSPIIIKPKRPSSGKRVVNTTLSELKRVHQAHTDALKSQVLIGLKKLTPEGFEIFSKKLLEAYGFEEMQVTSISKDGGIDGFGKLKVGLAYMNIAFQSKRWKTTNIHRTEIDRFRGAIQGKYEQGIFFSTSKFSEGSQAASFQPGAVPVIMIDGEGIVDLMIKKNFGIEQEFLPVYSNALDPILSSDED